MVDIVIIVPVYNEEEGIGTLPSAFEKYFLKTDLDCSVLLVDDGSTDQSLLKIQSICEQNPKFDYISLDQNRGLSTALKAGIDHAKASWIGYIDADLQTTPLDFLKLEQYMLTHDLVTGYRVGRKDNLTKKVTSFLANSFRGWLLGDGVRDSGCPLKLIRSKTARELPFFKGMHRFLPALVKLGGGMVKEVPVQHFPRLTGYSKFSFKNRLLGPIVDSFAVNWMGGRMIRYQIKNQSSSISSSKK
ncbi:MAG: dolichol-phosphate mannosyltransferase [Algoriphagus sp. 32-45-6]|nr:MAG: dolichol-phosphate mannosyltransferase [Algoriphagus sp. 32-45-6]